MKRFFDWRTRLLGALSSFEKVPFAWGTADCVIFANTCVKAMTGDDVLGSLSAPEYSDAKGALAAVKTIAADVQTVLAQKFEAVDPIYAHEGDIAVMDGTYTAQALGIVLGERVGVLSETGYATIPRSLMKAAFRVP